MSYLSVGVTNLRLIARADAGDVVLRGTTPDHYPHISLHLSAEDAIRLSAELLAAVEDHQAQTERLRAAVEVMA